MVPPWARHTAKPVSTIDLGGGSRLRIERTRWSRVMTWGRRKPTYKTYDWRLVASKDDLREYDAFGPWIYEIKDERDTPRRFRAACGRHYGARILLKVPRNIER